MRPETSTSGFTLIETLVGFLILSLSLLMVNQVLATVLKSRQVADHLRLADRLAQELLNGEPSPARQGIERGVDEGGLAWELSRQKLGSAGMDGPVVPLKITLDVKTSESGRLVRRYVTFSVSEAGTR